MEIKSPCIITPRLMPGVFIGKGDYISIAYSHQPGRGGRTRYKYYIDIPSYEYIGEDIQSGCQGGSLQEGLASLLSFLGAFAESRRYGKPDSGNWDLFPDALADWATANSDEFSMLELEIEESEQAVILE